MRAYSLDGEPYWLVFGCILQQAHADFAAKMRREITIKKPRLDAAVEAAAAAAAAAADQRGANGRGSKEKSRASDGPEDESAAKKQKR
jgi:hypothetical protein